MSTVLINPTSGHQPTDAIEEKRVYRRMSLRLPIECRRNAESGEYVVRTITQDVSTGGLYLELDEPALRKGDRLSVELTIPPSEGVSPYEGRGACEAEVVRTDRRRLTGETFDRFGVAVRFLGPLRISY